MTFKPSIQALIGPHTGIGSQCAIDWARRNVFVAGADSGFLTSNGLITGDEQAFKDLGTYVSPVGGGMSGDAPVAVDSNGFAYGNWFQHDGGGWIKVDPSTLAQLAAGGSGSGPPAGFILIGGSACVIHFGGTQYILATGETGLNYVALFNGVIYAGLNTTYGAGITGNSVAVCCAGQTGTKYGFIAYGPQSSGDTQKIFIEKVDVTGPSVTALANFLPAAVNGSWTTIYVAGICIDQTDGNLIVWFQNNTASVGGSQGAMVKIDRNTGAIIWNVSAPPNGGSYYPQLSFSSINHQQLAIITGVVGATVTTFDTSDGSSTSYSSGLAGIGNNPSQCYNDTLGCIVLSTTYSNDGATSPTPLNSTPISFNGWAVLYVNPAYVPPTPPPPEPGSDTVPSFQRATIGRMVRQLHLFPRPPVNTYRVTEATSVFPVTFRVDTQTDLRVTVNGVELDQSGFSYTGAFTQYPWFNRGFITLNVVASNCIIRVWSDPAPALTTNFVDGEFEKNDAIASLETLWIRHRAQHLKQTRDLEIPLTGSLTLPPATGGLHLRLAGPIVAGVAGIDTIYLGSQSGAVLTGVDTNAICEVVCVKTGVWFVRNPQGSWTIGASRNFRITSTGSTRVTTTGATRDILL